MLVSFMDFCRKKFDELVKAQQLVINTDDYLNFVGSFGKNIENAVKKTGRDYHKRENSCSGQFA
ncbi:hypothetical protein HNP38_003537 [Chryseobacterium defluvii]|uniref:Uncharacterized protein n=1 Tax=Chryseobacterium defluvii TaxID=160396 RepID=A0A840KG95_9FLAO|nr:hypothetical protein [Chryseobacterium defluvii]MBB4808196.1 hypothetical protein [Chryseobacterium defluvii]